MGVSSTIDTQDFEKDNVQQNRFFLVLAPISRYISETPNVFRIFDFDLKPAQIYLKMYLYWYWRYC